MASETITPHSEKFNSEKIKLINFISFLHGFAQSMAAYVLSSYFKEAFGTENVSIFYLIAYIFIFISLLNFHKVIKFFGRSKIFYSLILLQVFISLALTVVPVSWTGTMILILYIINSSLIAVACDIILECFSEDKLSGRIRGFNLTILNIGFLLGPFLSTQILEKAGYGGIFLSKFFIDIFIFGVAYFGLNGFNKKFDYCFSVKGLIKSVMHHKNLMRIYSMSFILDFFYAIMVIYSPIYLRNLGISWGDIGIIFTIMLIPFVLMQYPIGILADKVMGEKELIITSLCIMAPSVLLIYFINTTNVLVWGMVMLGTRIGAAMLEVLNDSYFYKRIDGNDVGVIDLYRTARPFAYIVATIISAVMLIFLPLKSVFILLSLVIIVGLYPASQLLDNKSESELKNKK